MRFADADGVRHGDSLDVDLTGGVLRNLATGEQYQCEPIPAFLLDLLRDGGLIPHLHKRLRPHL